MAFITEATRKDAIALVVATLGTAPSAELLADITSKLTSGSSMADIAAHLTSSDAYLAKYPAGQTANEVANDILDAAFVGATVSSAAREEAIEVLVAGLNSGEYSIASATKAVADYLSGANPAAAYSDAASAFQNRTDAAEAFTTTFTLEGAEVSAADLAAALEGVTSDAATLTAAEAAFEAGSKSIAAQAVIDAAAEEAAAEAAAEKAAEEKAAADAAAAEQALVDAATEAATAAATAIEAAEEADAALAAAKTASEEAAATAAETDADALATALETATEADADAKAALATAQEAYDDAIAAGDAAAVVTAQGEKLIAEDAAEKAAAALVEATTASEEATAADEAAATAATAYETALEAANTAGAAAETAAAAAATAAAATEDTDDDTAAAAQVTEAAAATEVADAIEEAAEEVAAEKVLTDAVAAAKTEAETAVTASATANTAAAEAIAAITDNASAAAALTAANAASTAAATATTAVAAYVTAAEATADEDDDTAADTLSTTAETQATAAAGYVTTATEEAAIDRSSQTFVLTNSANQTTGGADNFTGAVGNDSFLAFADQALDNGDVIDGGAGTDTLTARYAVGADTTINASVTNVENIIIDTDEGDAADHELNFTAAFTGLESITVQDAVATDAAGTDDINILTIPMGTELGITRGAAAVDIDFQFAGATGVTDSATLALNAARADTVTIAGIETLDVNAESGTSTIATLTATSAAAVNILGSGRVTITDIDDAADSINASAHTGTVSIAGIGNGNALNANTLIYGSGGNTFNIGANLTARDTVTGGAGTDRLIVSNSETAAIAGMSGVEQLEIDVADLDDGGAVTLAGTVSSDVTTFVVDVTTATDDDDGTVNITALDDGDRIIIADGGSDTTTLADGIALATAVRTDTTSNTLTIEFDAIGAVSADASDASGYALVEADEIDELTIQADTNALGTVTANGVESLSAATANTITFTGAGDFTADAVTNSTALTSIVASTMTGDLSLTGVDASALNYQGSAGSDVLIMGGLNAADVLNGGDDTDTVIATAVSGLSATTGVLNITDFETVIIQAAAANTIDASLLSGVTSLGFSGATPGDQTVTNLADGVTIAVGEATGAGVVFDNGDAIDITMADATGSDDSLTVSVVNDAAGTDVDLTVEDVETVTLAVTADTNNAQVLLANTEATDVIVTGGAAGATLTLGTLDTATTSLNATAYAGEISMTAASLASFTLTASSAAADDDYTLSAFNDTATIGATGAVDVDIDGGAGIDTLNLTVGTGFVDTGEIDNFEVINLTVAAGNDINIGANGTANTDANGLAEATSLNITGGNALSTLEIGDSAAASADNLTASTDIDASTFEGNIFVEFAADVMTSNTDVSAGALATDRVFSIFNAGGTDVTLALSGVETFTASVDSGADGGEQYNFDVNSAVGLRTIELLTTGAATLVDIDDYVDTLSVQLGSDIAGAVVNFEQDSEVDINLASNLGTADTVNLTLADTGDAAGTVDVDAAGVEVLNITQATTLTESHQISLAGVAPTTLSTLTINVVGGRAAETLTIADVAAGTVEINASTFASNLVITDRAATATTITGGSGADNIRMENSADILTGGTGSDTLTVAANAIIGGLAVDLSSTTDQITTFNGAANTAVQVGFENVDLSGYTGNGAEITAITSGSVITGTSQADQINLGAGADTITVATTTPTGADTVSSFATGAASDVIDVAALAEADFDTVGGDILATTGFVVLGAAGDAVASLTAALAVVELANYDGQIGANEEFFFAVDDGTSTGIFFFNDADGGADASAGEATLIMTLVGVDDATDIIAANVGL